MTAADARMQLMDTLLDVKHVADDLAAIRAELDETIPGVNRALLKARDVYGELATILNVPRHFTTTPAE